MICCPSAKLQALDRAEKEALGPFQHQAASHLAQGLQLVVKQQPDLLPASTARLPPTHFVRSGLQEATMSPKILPLLLGACMLVTLAAGDACAGLPDNALIPAGGCSPLYYNCAGGTIW